MLRGNVSAGRSAHWVTRKHQQRFLAVEGTPCFVVKSGNSPQPHTTARRDLTPGAHRKAANIRTLNDSEQRSDRYRYAAGPAKLNLHQEHSRDHNFPKYV
jgi:hypothetical protein